jgi:hypothetical protein
VQRSTRVARTLTAIPVAALLVAMSACSSGDKLNGEEKKKPEQVVTDAKNALKASKTVHLAGNINETDEGKSTTLNIDLHFLNGTGAYGFITISGKRLDIIRVGKDVYAKGDESVLGSAASVAKGKYIKLSATSGSGKDLADLTDLNAFANQVLSPSGKLEPSVGRGKVDGKKAVILTDTDKNGPGKLYVANTGKPVPLQISGSGSSTGKLAFTEYDADVSVKAPAAAETITPPAGSS